jgi:predicted Zn-dependent peptidase
MTTAWGQKLDRSVRPKPGPAPKISLGKTEDFTLPNGMRVFVVENHKLPTVTYSIEFAIKPELEGNMAGYKAMMSDLLTSGTKTRSNEKLNSEIDYIGARIAADHESMYGSSLKKHQNKLLELMSDIAMNANFTQAELDKIKKRTLSALETEKNEPDAMLKNVSAAVNFGKQHPYGEIPTETTVKNVTLDKVKSYYSTYYRPNVAYMAVVGDVTVAEVKPLIEKYFGGWQKATVPVAAYNANPAPTTTNVVFVPREAAVQSVVNVTYPIDLQPGTPDVIKAKVANSILGGGSNGRLFLNLREAHGWTYGSYSSIVQDELKGTFTAYAKMRNVVSDSSVAELISEMRKLQTEKVGSEELQNHISNMSGAFAIGLENPQTVAQYAINIERYKMPKDYYQNYLKNLSAVTAEDVQNMARKYINPDKANIVVVGSKSDVAPTLAKYDKEGGIAYYDNYGQPIVETATAAVPANISANDVMSKYISAIGGEKAINGIKDIKTVSKGTLNMGGQELQLTITEMKKAPGMLMQTVEGMGMVLQKQAYNGKTGYMEQQGQKMNLEGDDLANTKMEADIYADLNPAKYGIKRSIKSMDKVNGKDAYVVEVTDAANKKSTEYYEVATGLLVKEIKSEEGPGGQTFSIATEYSDYKEVPGSNGYKIPYTIKQSGPMSITASVETAEVNKGIPDTEFN